MTRAIEELKTRARLRLNAARKADEVVSLRLRDCLHEVSRQVGFLQWDPARQVLGGRRSWAMTWAAFGTRRVAAC